ncbi:MAG: Zn-dependent hydrolase [Geodermatophilaceae bacterium]
MSVSSAPVIVLDRLRRDIEHVAQFGARQGGGISRTSFSLADRQVRSWLEQECARYGLPLRTDRIGNQFIRVEARDAPPGTPPVWTGSHLDTVPDGGRLDGILGSLAALEVARRLVEEEVVLRRPIDVAVFADEEGNYHHLMGSTGLVSDYDPDELTQLRGRDGDLLIDALAGMGWDTHARTAVAPGEIHAFVELHIEQGAVLEAHGIEIGVVTGIVGLGAGRLEFRGRQDHAGTTPMDMRRDALLGAADLLVQLPAVAGAVSGEAVVTCGILELEPGGSNVVPGVARVQLDFRDPDPARLVELEQGVVRAAQESAHRHDVEASYTRESITEPVPMDPRIQDIVESAATSQGLSTLRMPSGAGHDAQNLARIAPTGMIFVPSVQGRSHSPAEHTPWKDIGNGASVLLRAVHRLATE